MPTWREVAACRLFDVELTASSTRDRRLGAPRLRATSAFFCRARNEGAVAIRSPAAGVLAWDVPDHPHARLDLGSDLDGASAGSGECGAAPVARADVAGAVAPRGEVARPVVQVILVDDLALDHLSPAPAAGAAPLALPLGGVAAAMLFAVPAFDGLAERLSGSHAS
jgi:hypothetical protein